MPEEVTSTEELEDMVESTEADTALIPSTLTGIVDVNNFSFKEIATVLSKSIGEFKKDTILTPVFVMAETILEVLIPFRTAALVDTLRAGADLNAILQSGLILTAMAMLSLLFGTLSGISVAKASTGFARNLRRDMFRNIQKFSFTTIDAFSSSSLVTRLTTDISNVQMAFMMLIRMAVRAPFMFISAFIAGFIMGGWLAIIFVAVMPLLGIGLYLIISRVIPIFKKVFKKYDALNESAEENLAGIRVVKSFVNENFERQKFNKASEELREDFTSAERLIALNSPFMNFTIYVLFVFILYFGPYLIVSSQGTAFSVGQLSSLITYGFMMLMALMMLSFVFAMIIIAEEGARRICEVLLATSTINNPENPITKVTDGSIDFKNVGFSYSGPGGREALSDVNLHINSGEVIGIIGGTGSAKSTLVQLIPRLYDVTAGSVSVGGHDVRDYDIDTLRSAVAMVLQKNVLFSGTIKENLLWGNPNATDEEILEAARLAQADSFVQTFPDKYETHIEQGGNNVSGGQKQRLCIARALLKRPKVLILDDSTSAVDTKTDSLIRTGLKDYLPDTTKIIIAQRTSSIEESDKIIVLDNGRINAIGTHEELLKDNPIYREVYFSQNKQSVDENQSQEGEVTSHE
ncbi:ABC transporter related [Lancefieldella parvula DSM 20469]|uniref:ABC transporter related n=1 Tax=Lancefieldella parvula (strain ATCC 33793 / DSM 20469 / CCUG 32760 / JCM 10300 / KCTC 3663 / VPI 0546 / 1246) TaxID=521095 RepID=C8W773_LANP1|nr:ABC transporter ATP-binding protein [Lancefieldella parvula]ACV51313.1 ABC transporter related [Lancefieldella parvula DSM 20469]